MMLKKKLAPRWEKLVSYDLKKKKHFCLNYQKMEYSLWIEV